VNAQFVAYNICISYNLNMKKHKVAASIKKRYVKKGGDKLICKAGYTSHRLSRRRPETVKARSKRSVLNNKFVFKILAKEGVVVKPRRNLVRVMRSI
jgi:ribosomal protein L35